MLTGVASTLYRAWRLFGTGFSFASFGLGGLALALTWFPLLNLAIRDPRRRRAVAHSTIRASFRLFLWEMKFLRVIDYKIENAHLLTDDSRCIVVANHPTLIDVVLLGSVMPRCDCIVKEEILQNVFMRGVARAAGYIPNAEGARLLKQCEALLTDGGTLLIFPEGTRTVPSKPIKVKRGAAQIAVRLDRDMRLVHIRCQPATLFKGQKWYQIPPRRPFFHVKIMERIPVRPFLEGVPVRSVAARRLTTYLATALNPDRDATARKQGQTPTGLEGRLQEPALASLERDRFTPFDIVSDALSFKEVQWAGPGRCAGVEADDQVEMQPQPGISRPGHPRG